MGVFENQRGFGFEFVQLDFVHGFAESVMNQCDLFLRIFGCGPVAKDAFKACQLFATQGDIFVANFLTKFTERIKSFWPSTCVAPGIAAFLKRLTGHAVFCSVLHFHFSQYVAACLSVNWCFMRQLYANRSNCCKCLIIKVAEGVRFELTRPFGLPVFKTGAINRSATPPEAGDQ